MTFGITESGLRIKRLEDILAEKRQAWRDQFGESIDLSSGSPEGQIIALEADREAQIWELVQFVYDAGSRSRASGKQLDDAISLTGNVRLGARRSLIFTGQAEGENGTILDPSIQDIFISVQGSATSRFKIVGGPYIINSPENGSFVARNIQLESENTGEVQALAGTLTNIETPLPGFNSFTNLEDAQLGSEIEQDFETKARVDRNLQIAGSATIEAILSELRARPLVTAAVVFQNNLSIPDPDGRPPKSLEIVVEGDNEEDLAMAIFLVIGGGVQTIGDIQRTVIDSQGFQQNIRFSRPTSVSVYVIANLTVDNSTFPIDGQDQVRNAIVAFEENLDVGNDVIVFGSSSLICVFNDIPGILDIELFIGRDPAPSSSNNLIISPRERANFDTSRTEVNI